MVNRLIATGFGIAAMAFAPAAAAAFPEDLSLPASSSSSSSLSSSTSSVPTGLSVSSADDASASSLSSSSSVASESSASSEASHADENDAAETVESLAGQELTRAEFTALIVEQLYTRAQLDSCYWDITSPVPPGFTLVFTDVHVDDRYAKHVCVAMKNGLVKGHGDGSFRPNDKISFAEASKILARAFALAPYAEPNGREPWYREYVEALAERGAIPVSIDRMDHLMTAAETADMFTRVHEGVTSLPSRTYDDLHPQARTPRARVTAPDPSPSTAAPSRPTASSASSAASEEHSSAAASQSSSSEKSFWDWF